ncbi:MAG: EamA family transporter [Ignavibacteriales bacterium]|nr:EamA family transporter [Ignavibacteriales bacterium]
MIYLTIVSIVWALSFSLIKGNLTSLDSNFVAFARLLISFLIFLPFLRIKTISQKIVLQLMLIGAIQYGIMYTAYIYAYKYLQAYEIAIMTILTPIFVVLFSDIWNKKIKPLNWIAAVLTILGSAIIIYSESARIGFWKGVLFIQLSNICFAFGQVYFKKISEKYKTLKPLNIFAILFLGAIIVTGVFSFSTTNFSNLQIDQNQLLTLIYLGAVASGVGFYFWNLGVTKVGTGTLAIMNNLKIPLGVLFAFLIVGEKINILQFAIGSAVIILAFIITEKYSKVH